MKHSLIFEIGVEEIPSQYVATMAKSLNDNAEKMFDELRLMHGNLSVYYTPRRFSLFVEELADEQNALKITQKGPNKKIAFDADGNPTKALQGFLRKNNKTIDDVFIDEKDGKVAVDLIQPVEKTVEVLKDGLTKLVTQIYNPNPMRWGGYKIKFIRPIRWLMALYGDQVVSVEIECAVSSNLSYGHRTLANHPISISSAENYFDEMEKGFVIVDQKKRKEMIIGQLRTIEEENGFEIDKDEALLDEVCNIVEYPTCALGHFDEKYLSLPECIIKDPLKNQQRYFPVYKDGRITNAFVYTRNGGSYFIDNVTRGNERVLRPRLEDAEFFYNSDLKTPISEKADALANVVFVDKGGSYADKAKRVESIALMLANRIGYAETDFIKQTARIMKADLVSAVVREYTDTQGLVGGVFAEKEGYDPRVCTAISEQYLPNFYGDKLPSEELSAIISVADKLDSLMCLSAVGLKPMNSSDPYGLRRQVLGIFNIALERNLNLDLDSFVPECEYLYSDMLKANHETVDEYEAFLKEYLFQRLRVFLHDEKKYSYEDLDKISLSDLNVYKSVKKANLIGEIREEQWYIDFLQIFNRIVKLVRSSKETSKGFDASIVDPDAAEMYDAFYCKRETLLKDIADERYEDAIKTIGNIGTAINSFMESNLALCENTQLRLNRLAFFEDFCNICGSIIQI